MSDLQLFRIAKGKATEVEGTSVELEKGLQKFIESNLEAILGIRFVGTEVATGQAHRGRIDTLGLDENGCPVIIEYKRRSDEAVVSQGLYYLDWLADHHGDFEVLVRDRIGKKAAEEIDWTNARLVCVAADFTKYDEHAVRQIPRNIDLVRYVKFEDDLFLVELVHRNAPEAATPGEKAKPVKVASPFRLGVKNALGALTPEQRKLFHLIASHLEGLGDDVTVRKLKYYWAFSRLKNFACLETKKSKIVVHLTLNPKSVKLVPGFTRNVRGVGHWGTGDLQVAITKAADFERAKPLMLRAYEGRAGGK